MCQELLGLDTMDEQIAMITALGVHSPLAYRVLIVD